MRILAGRIVSRRAGPAALVVLTVVGSLLTAAGSGAADPRYAAPTDRLFVWPLDPRPAVGRAFAPPDRNWLPGHRGVDLTAAPGQTVRSAGDGIVVFAGTVAGKPVVSVDHPGGLRTTYEPVIAAVESGRRVFRGDPLGTVEAGHDGCPSTGCLHWGLRRDRDDYLDPLPLVERPVIRLHPV